MILKPLPDVSSAVACFLANFRRLRYLPFIQDIEAIGLFGAEVSAALVEIDEYNRDRQICAQCHSHCCLRVKCELYDARFGGCPVETWRPALCRLHFCDKFVDYGPLVKILGDIYLESLLAAAKIDSALADMFDCPAFAPLTPHLVSLISPLLDKARSGTMSEEDARSQILVLIESNSAART